MSFQQCPNCNGSGRTSAVFSMNTSEQCSVCKGHKIISEETGKPPSGEPSDTTK